MLYDILSLEGGFVKNIVIAGAGPAGLTCAYYLLKGHKDCHVTILEEKSIVGGISRTEEYHGNHMDIGGHRFFTKNETVLNFWKDILPMQGKPALDEKLLGIHRDYHDGKRDPEKEDAMLIRNRISRIYYHQKFFDYPVNLTMKTIRNMGLLTTFRCGLSYLKASLWKKEESNLENFYINRFGNELYEMFFKGYTTKLWGRSPKEIDSSWGSQRVKGISISKVLSDYFKRLFHIKDTKKEVSLTDYFYYPKLGPGEFYELLAHKIEKMGGEIYRNSRVVKIHKKNQRIVDVTYEKEGKREVLPCDQFVSSMPMKDLLEEMNSVPKNVLDVSNHLPYRDFVTVGVLVPNLDLEKNSSVATIHGNIPDNWLYIQDTSVKVGRVQVFNNWSPYMVEDPIHTMWIGMEYFCLEGDSFWKKSDEDLKKIAKRELKKIGFYDGAILDSCVIKEKKAYPAYFDSYKDIDVVRNYIDTIDNLYCIGRNGTHSYNNMDHSILSGMICADLIHKNSHDLEALWNVNVDQSYQEEK